MLLNDNRVTLQGENGLVEIERNEHGVPVISAYTFKDASFALGWVHANDRQLQMMLTRIVFQGRASEKIAASRDLIEADKYIRSILGAPDNVPAGKMEQSASRLSLSSFISPVTLVVICIT